MVPDVRDTGQTIKHNIHRVLFNSKQQIFKDNLDMKTTHMKLQSLSQYVPFKSQSIHHKNHSTNKKIKNNGKMLFLHDFSFLSSSKQSSYPEMSPGPRTTLGPDSERLFPLQKTIQCVLAFHFTSSSNSKLTCVSAVCREMELENREQRSYLIPYEPTLQAVWSTCDQEKNTFY